jgi:hypothetical protein
MRRWALVAALLVGACGVPPEEHEVTGPFTGDTYRFAVIDLRLPVNQRDLAFDLNGDGKSDNQLGALTSILASQGLLGDGAVVRAGGLRAFVELTSDDPTLKNDPTVGVRFIAEGAASDEMGARLTNGRLVANPPGKSRRAVAGALLLPLIARGGLFAVHATALYVDLSLTSLLPHATLHGALDSDEMVRELAVGLNAALAVDPDRPQLLELFDTGGCGDALPGDGHLDDCELAESNLIKSVLRPDVDLFDAAGNLAPSPNNEDPDVVSFGVMLTLQSCAEISCSSTTEPSCHDRRQNGLESDVDCGGPCAPCRDGAACGQDLECRSLRCVAGRCAAPTCMDGVLNGRETDLDCGDFNDPACPACQLGHRCKSHGSCASNLCANLGVGLVCAEPRCGDGHRNLGESDVDCGGPCPPCPSGAACQYNDDCMSGQCQIVVERRCL